MTVLEFVGYACIAGAIGCVAMALIVRSPKKKPARADDFIESA